MDNFRSVVCVLQATVSIAVANCVYMSFRSSLFWSNLCKILVCLFYQVLRSVYEKFPRLSCIWMVFLSVLLCVICSVYVIYILCEFKHLTWGNIFFSYYIFFVLIPTLLLRYIGFLFRLLFMWSNFSPLFFVSIYLRYSSDIQHIFVVVASCLFELEYLVRFPVILLWFFCDSIYHLTISFQHVFFICFSPFALV